MLERKINWYEETIRGGDGSRWRPNMRAIANKALAKKKKDGERIKEAG
jgi:hypothetical protein